MNTVFFRNKNFHIEIFHRDDSTVFYTEFFSNTCKEDREQAYDLVRNHRDQSQSNLKATKLREVDSKIEMDFWTVPHHCMFVGVHAL